MPHPICKTLDFVSVVVFTTFKSKNKREGSGAGAVWTDHFSSEALTHQLDAIHLGCPALFLLGATCVPSILKPCVPRVAEHFEVQLPACYKVPYQHRFQIFTIAVCPGGGAVLG